MLNQLVSKGATRCSRSVSPINVAGLWCCRSTSCSRSHRPRRSVVQAQSSNAASNGPRPSQVTDDYWISCLPDSQHPDISLSQQPEGKWLLFYKKGQLLDDAWDRATQLFHQGELRGVYGMKVSTARRIDNSSDHSEGVIIFYCGFEDEEAETKDVGRTIVDKMKYTGPDPSKPPRYPRPKIFWKPNNQTTAGQYAKDGKRASKFWVEYRTVNKRAAAAAAQLAGQPVECNCGLEVVRLTSRSVKNPNRDYLCCRKPRGDASRCNYFVWADEVGT